MIIMAERKEIVLALGSNFDQEINISKAKAKLYDLFGNDIIFSEQIWTIPIGMLSDKFLNCLAFVHTSYPLEYINKALKHIELICGTQKHERAKNIVKIDIDILKYGEKILHANDWTREYVVKLMKTCPFNTTN